MIDTDGALRAYLALNTCLAISWGGMRLMRQLGVAAEGRVGLSRAALLASFTLVVWASRAPSAGVFRPAAQVFDGPPAAWTREGGALVRAALAAPVGAGWSVEALVTAGLLLGIAAGMLRLGGAAWALRRIVRAGLPLSRAGRVRVVVSDRISVPFAAWWPREAWVALPEGLLGAAEAPDGWRLALRHELQHHRHGDTRWVWVWSLLRGLCFWNPCAHALAAEAAEAQELRCDEALMRRGVDRGAYARCLLWAASQTLLRPPSPLPALPMVGRAPRSTLERRLDAMIRWRPTPSSPWPGRLALLCCLPLLAAAASTAAGAPTLDEATVVALAAPTQGTTFPIPVNDPVMKALDRLHTDAEARAFMNTGLGRLAALRPDLEARLTAGGLPPELVAVVLVESGAANLPETSTEPSMAPGQRGAGLWMFIPSTARAYGLTVDGAVDERLDPAKETQAAVRLLGDLYGRYGDWGLALSAYNMGHKAVDAAIAAGGSRDPWVLIAQGHLNGYAAAVMAAALVLRDPSLVS